MSHNNYNMLERTSDGFHTIIPNPIQVVHLAVYFYFAVALVGRQSVDGKDEDEIDLYVPVFLVFEFLFYFGWLNVAANLYNPFGDDDDDFELLGLLKRHVKVCMSIVEEDDDDIPNVEDVNFWKSTAGEVLSCKSGFQHNLGMAMQKCLHTDCFCYV